MRVRRALRPELLLVLLLAMPCDGKKPQQVGQHSSGGGVQAHPSSTQQPGADEGNFIDEADVVSAGRHLRQFYLEQQKSMVKDTDKLLQLATELNAEVSREHSGTLTPDERHKAEKIEKMARSVRDKMSTPVPGPLLSQKPRTTYAF
jgi:hypothetical protein